MSKYFKFLYKAEKSLQDEYIEKNNKIFNVFQNDNIQKKYNKIVNFYSFVIFQGISLFWIYKRGTKGSFRIKSIPSVSQFIGKCLLMTTININIFINKSGIVKSYLKHNETKITTRLDKFKFFMNPLFLLQKDKFILKIISFFNSNRSGQSLDIKSTQLPKESSNTNQVKEGFL